LSENQNSITFESLHVNGGAEIEALYSQAPFGLALISEDLRYIRINPFLAKLNGAPPADHIGCTIHQIIPTFAKIFEPKLREVLTTAESNWGFFLRGDPEIKSEQRQIMRRDYYPIKRPDGTVAAIGAIVREADLATVIKKVHQKDNHHGEPTDSTFLLQIADECFLSARTPGVRREIAEGLDAMGHELMAKAVAIDAAFQRENQKNRRAPHYRHPV
jgi:PAS domain-containing protein